MNLRYELALSEQEMAEIVDTSLKDYLMLEYATESIPLTEYEKAMQKLNTDKTKKRIEMTWSRGKI